MKKTFFIVVGFLIILSIIIYSYEFIVKKPDITAPTIDQVDEVFLPMIEVKEQQKDSTYTFVGDIPVPTPCHEIKSKVNKILEKEYQIEILVIPPKPGVMCAQVETQKTFKVSFQAQPDINITAMVSGIKYELNRFLLSNEENIDTFKLEIKG